MHHIYSQIAGGFQTPCKSFLLILNAVIEKHCFFFFFSVVDRVLRDWAIFIGNMGLSSFFSSLQACIEYFFRSLRPWGRHLVPLY